MIFYRSALIPRKLPPALKNSCLRSWKEKFHIVTGQTEFRLVGWNFIKQYFLKNFQSSHSQIICKMVWLNISQNSQENISAASFLIKFSAFQLSSSAIVFSCEIYNIIKNTTFIEHPSVNASKLPVTQVSSIVKVVQELLQRVPWMCVKLIWW